MSQLFSEPVQVTRSWFCSATTPPGHQITDRSPQLQTLQSCLVDYWFDFFVGQRGKRTCGNIEEPCGRLQSVNTDLSIEIPNCDVAPMFLEFTTVHTDSPAFIAVSGMFAGSLESLSWGRLRGA
jgi:hypothetical protein